MSEELLGIDHSVPGGDITAISGIYLPKNPIEIAALGAIGAMSASYSHVLLGLFRQLEQEAEKEVEKERTKWFTNTFEPIKIQMIVKNSDMYRFSHIEGKFASIFRSIKLGEKIRKRKLQQLRRQKKWTFTSYKKAYR